jgi:prevent-host-death family protein
MVLFDMTIEILAVVRLAKTEENAYNLVTVTSEAVTMKSERREKNSTIGIGERWRLQDAKARFSEVVKRAREHGPQRVTLHGKDAVVIVSAESYDRARERHTGRRLVEALAASPLGDIMLERPFISGPVRDVEV